MTEEILSALELAGWIIHRGEDVIFAETPCGSFIIEEDFDAFWVAERSGENEYTSVDAYSNFEAAHEQVKKWLN